MEIAPVHTLNLRGVLTVSKRIILARRWHFFSLSIFFLPLSFHLTIIPTLPVPDQKLLISYLLYTIIVYILALCAIGTITYSTHHAFFGQPVKFLDALKSLSFSFFPLASTAIMANVLILLISLSFLLFIGTLLMSVHTLGFVIDYNSTYFMWFLAIVGAILIAMIIYVHVEWSLAFVVVVVESKWGFAPLMRSSRLVNGMRSVSLFVMLYFGVCGALGVWVLMWYANLHTVFLTMLAMLFVMMLLLRITAANTVLYNYSKALHGELELDQVAEGFVEVLDRFVHDYMNFPALTA
ncbi:hypothetical protein L1987_79387 [Smallanthus sonchifolius]|uniref:Uncharacterized protein n=1 Tax=Smallanthus sonchifolius TaxID=185202 RepID=A0ACB8ZFI2_9ASTR|nr:hypothetical protein L1987_79387 [Smallanthus sonchifolius]